MSGIFGRSSALSGDPWDVPAILDAWSTPATLDNQPATTTTTPSARPQCAEGETWDANSSSCAKIGMTSTDVKTLVAPDAAAASSTSKLTFSQALPYVLGAAAAGVLLMVLMGKKKMTANYRKTRMRMGKKGRSVKRRLTEIQPGVFVPTKIYHRFLVGDADMQDLEDAVVGRKSRRR